LLARDGGVGGGAGENVEAVRHRVEERRRLEPERRRAVLGGEERPRGEPRDRERRDERHDGEQ